MSLSAQASAPGPGVARWIARWWHDWTSRRRMMTQLDCCGAAEVERMAHDVGVSSGELCALAGKWPDAAEPLNRRLVAIGLDPEDVRRNLPQVMHDLQRVCTLCQSVGECVHDLAAKPSSVAWRGYCPNVMTLDALRAAGKPAEAFSGKVEAGFPQKMRPPVSKVN
jgi:hypothetical protein